MMNRSLLAVLAAFLVVGVTNINAVVEPTEHPMSSEAKFTGKERKFNEYLENAKAEYRAGHAEEAEGNLKSAEALLIELRDFSARTSHRTRTLGTLEENFGHVQDTVNGGNSKADYTDYAN